MSLMLAALFLAADPAVATASQAPAEPAKAKRICKVDPAHTGSRMKKKLCLTETEWAQLKAGKTAGELKTLGAR